MDRILEVSRITCGIPQVGFSAEYKSLIMGLGSSQPLGE